MVKDCFVLVSGIYHKLFLLLRIPLLTSFFLYKIMHSSLSNNTRHPWSHNLVTDIRFLLRPGMTYPSLAFVGTCEIGRIVFPEDVIVAPFGTVTLMGVWLVFICSLGAEGLT